MSMYRDVVAFQYACGQVPTSKNADLYSTLIKEEYMEFIEAGYCSDDNELLDGAMDMIWVILGYCHMKGYDVTGAWEEVRKSNMAKVNPHTGKVDRREDGKILKPEGWTEPDMSKFIGR